MKSRKFRIYGCVAIAIAIVAFIAIVSNKITGQSASSSVKRNSISNALLSCASTEKAYPYFTYDESDKKELSLNLVFSNNTLKTIYLYYRLYYTNTFLIEASEAHNHAAMNISYANDGLEPDSFNSNYTKLSDSMRFSIYLDGEELRTVRASSYFLLDITNSKTPSTIEEFKSFYEKNGLGCNITN